MAQYRLDNHQGASLLSISNLTFTYASARSHPPVLRDINLQLGHGEVLALLGSSGCGKSTLLNLVSGIEVARTGSVLIEGVEMIGLADRERTLKRRRDIGFIYQFFNLIPTLTALENISLVLELNGYARKESVARALESLEAVELGACANRYPDQLSGGEQQRVAIARALVHSPSLVLADEPTGNLDGRSGRRVMVLLHELVAAQGTGMILVTHSREVAASADRILELQDGQLVEIHLQQKPDAGDNTSPW